MSTAAPLSLKGAVQATLIAVADTTVSVIVVGAPGNPDGAIGPKLANTPAKRGGGVRDKPKKKQTNKQKTKNNLISNAIKGKVQ